MSHVPPAAVAAAAQQGLDLRAALPPSKRGGTAVGLARARDLAGRRPISDATLARMRSYFARHVVDAQAPGWGVDSKGWQAWLLWGGDAGRQWAESFRQRNPAGGQMNGTKQDADHFKQGYRFAVCCGIKRHAYCKDRATAAAEANQCGGWAAEMRSADGKVTLTRLGGAKAPAKAKNPSRSAPPPDHPAEKMRLAAWEDGLYVFSLHGWEPGAEWRVSVGSSKQSLPVEAGPRGMLQVRYPDSWVWYKTPEEAAQAIVGWFGRTKNPPLEPENAAVLLEHIPVGKSRQIHGITVKRVAEDHYQIGGKTVDLVAALEVVQAKGAKAKSPKKSEKPLASGDASVVMDLGNNERAKIGIFKQPSGEWLALTLARSQWFKTRGGAVAWLERNSDYRVDGNSLIQK